jgi:hypothetical protein
VPFPFPKQSTGPEILTLVMMIDKACVLGLPTWMLGSLFSSRMVCLDCRQLKRGVGIWSMEMANTLLETSTWSERHLIRRVRLMCHG